MRKQQSRKKRHVPPKTVLRLPDLDQAKSAVLNRLTSVDAQRGYGTQLTSSSMVLRDAGQATLYRFQQEKLGPGGSRSIKTVASSSPPWAISREPLPSSQ
jgi:hypothetical protein